MRELLIKWICEADETAINELYYFIKHILHK